MRIALYARVSSTRQEQERTIASQLDALQSYALSHGHEVVPKGVFCDDGVSGARLDRPALDALRDAARIHAFEGILVHSPDRLARNYAYQVLILEELERLGIRAMFVEQPPLDDPAARLLVEIQGAVAEYERAKIAERNRRGRLFRLRQGEVSVSAEPYGYRRIPRTSSEPAHLVVEEQGAAVVRQMFAWHVQEGLSLRSIARRLQGLGVPTPKGGLLWAGPTVAKILRNSVYTGTWVVNRTRSDDAKTNAKAQRPEDEWITLTVPAIIDRETFLRSQQRHAENIRFSPRHLKEQRWLLRGLVRCGLCHHAAVAVRTPAGHGQPHFNDYYRCRNTTDTLTPCSAPYISAPALDELVWSEVRQTLCNPLLLQQAIQGGATVSEDVTLLAQQRDSVERQIRTAEKERTRLVDAYQAGAIDLKELNHRQAGLQLRLEQWRNEQERLRELAEQGAAEQQILERVEYLSSRVRDRIDEMEFEERQVLLREVLESVEATPYEVVLRYRIPLPPTPTTREHVPDANNLSTKLRLRQRRRRRLPLAEGARAHLAGVPQEARTRRGVRLRHADGLPRVRPRPARRSHRPATRREAGGGGAQDRPPHRPGGPRRDRPRQGAARPSRGRTAASHPSRSVTQNSSHHGTPRDPRRRLPHAALP